MLRSSVPISNKLCSNIDNDRKLIILITSLHALRTLNYWLRVVVPVIMYCLCTMCKIVVQVRIN